MPVKSFENASHSGASFTCFTQLGKRADLAGFVCLAASTALNHQLGRPSHAHVDYVAQELALVRRLTPWEGSCHQG
jgi:hypothetical protein